MVENISRNMGRIPVAIKWALLLGLTLQLFCFPGIVHAQERLHQAAHDGDIELVRKILKTTVDPDQRDDFGGTALHAAMFQKNTEIIELLLDYGFDPNAQGTANGYTPLHDAVWADNLDAVIILLKNGANPEIQAKDGLTPHAKAVKEGKMKIARQIAADRDRGPSGSSHGGRSYRYGENDIKAFVYRWFAAFDHLEKIDFFKQHLDPDQVKMHFPGFPIRSMGDFERWYGGVIDTIEWNTHRILNLTVSGDEKSGFTVALDIHWQAKGYDGTRHDMKIHQQWKVSVNNAKTFIIRSHHAEKLEPR